MIYYKQMSKNYYRMTKMFVEIITKFRTKKMLKLSQVKDYDEYC